MTQSYFLVTDDDTAGNPNPNRRTLWGTERSKHVFTITSPVDQTIYISAHTWPLRSYPHDCRGADGPQTSVHYVIVTDKDGGTPNNADSDRAGKWLRMAGHSYYAGFTMTAGQQLEVEFGMDWKTNESHDFSLVVWGTGDQQTSIQADLAYTRGLSSHWPLTVMQADDQNAEQESTADLCKENP